MSNKPKPELVPQFRAGKILWVDPQVARWRKKRRQYRAVIRQTWHLLESSRIDSEACLDFWSTPSPTLGGETPLEHVSRPLLGRARNVLKAARAFIREN